MKSIAIMLGIGLGLSLVAADVATNDKQLASFEQCIDLTKTGRVDCNINAVGPISGGSARPPMMLSILF